MKILAISLLICVALCFTMETVEIDGKISDAACVKEMSSIIAFRGYLGIGKVDPNVKENIAAMNKVGVATGAYMIPCPKCGNPEKQINELLEATHESKAVRYFIHILAGQWPTDLSANRKFVQGLVRELKNKGKIPGFVSNTFHWEKILGKDFEEMKEYMLWYLDADNDATCDDFIPFGGWKKPWKKVYSLNNAHCGAHVDYVFKCPQSP